MTPPSPASSGLRPIGKLAAATGKDGKILAMPWDSGTMALYLRSDYLSDAGIDPATLTSWDAFAQAAEQVKAKLGKTAFDTDFQTFITEGAWGSVWSRPGLTRRERSAARARLAEGVA